MDIRTIGNSADLDLAMEDSHIFEDSQDENQKQDSITEEEGNSRYKSRMYENKLPEADSVVMVNVRKIAEMGAYVRLLEYDNIEGMILLSELSRRRIRSIQKLIRVKRNEVVVVLRVDKEKGYIDLSKRRVSPEDVVKCEEKYKKSKAVHSIMRHVAKKLDMNLEGLYQSYIWPLVKKWGHAYEAFKVAIHDPERVFKGTDIPPEILNEIHSCIKRRLTPVPIKIRADFELACFEYKGIDSIKSALKSAIELSTPESPISINLVAPPIYVMTTSDLDKAAGIEKLNKALSCISQMIAQHNGKFVIRMKPRAVNETDDVELEQLMARVGRENAEISGDEDNSEEGQSDEYEV